MNIFFDTSSFTKLYHKEEGTKELFALLGQNPGYRIYLSELTIVEIYSAILKKVRIGHLSMIQAEYFLTLIDSDLKKAHLITVDSALLKVAQGLVTKYGVRGLRALDAIQLASAINAKGTIGLALTGDIILKRFLTEEGINCEF